MLGGEKLLHRRYDTRGTLGSAREATERTPDKRNDGADNDLEFHLATIWQTRKRAQVEAAGELSAHFSHMQMGDFLIPADEHIPRHFFSPGKRVRRVRAVMRNAEKHNPLSLGELRGRDVFILPPRD
jgi:hypothetical protein